MTFGRRVSAFFLGALALALAGYSIFFYFIARAYLYEQFDARLQGAMDILAASVEVEPDDAKWQPGEHGIRLDRDVLVESRWIVADESGQTIDRSPGLARDLPEHGPLFEYSAQHHPEMDEPVQIGHWRILQRQLNAPTPKPVADREPHEFAAVRITVARSAAALYGTVRRLGTLLIVLSALVWLVAAVTGRRYIVRALRPVRAMAEQAQSMSETDFGRRLPIAPTHDELAMLGVEFNRLLDRLQHAYERQRRFTGDSAHQLRTPLTILQGQIDVAMRRERSSAEYQKLLGTLATQVAELVRIVESLLFLARTDDGASSLATETVSLNRWLADYIARWAEHGRKSDLQLIITDDAQLTLSTALLSQLLDNLLHNALKYSPAGTPVLLRSERRGQHVVISVTDSGPGISPEDQASIFEPFFRSAEARRAGVAGTGLGLAIAARIAGALHGVLRCDSRPGAGATFSLEIPAHSQK